VVSWRGDYPEKKDSDRTVMKTKKGDKKSAKSKEKNKSRAFWGSKGVEKDQNTSERKSQ